MITISKKVDVDSEATHDLDVVCRKMALFT